MWILHMTQKACLKCRRLRAVNIEPEMRPWKAHLSRGAYMPTEDSTCSPLLQKRSTSRRSKWNHICSTICRWRCHPLGWGPRCDSRSAAAFRPPEDKMSSGPWPWTDSQNYPSDSCMQGWRPQSTKVYIWHQSCSVRLYHDLLPQCNVEEMF